MHRTFDLNIRFPDSLKIEIVVKLVSDTKEAEQLAKQLQAAIKTPAPEKPQSNN